MALVAPQVVMLLTEEKKNKSLVVKKKIGFKPCYVTVINISLFNGGTVDEVN